VYLWASPSDKGAVVLGKHGASVTSLLFSADGRHLTSASVNGEVKIWNVATRKEFLTYNQLGNPSNRVTLHPGGKLVASIVERTLLLHGLNKRATCKINAPDCRLNCTAFDSTGKLVAVGGLDGIASVYDVRTGRERITFQTQGSINDIAFGHGFHMLAIASMETGGAITLWELRSGRMRAKFRASANGCLSVAISPDNRWLVAGERILDFWDLSRHGSKTTSAAGAPALCLAFRLDSRIVISGHDDGTIRCWDVSSIRKRQGNK
jgi:hypothetical protein